MVRYANRFISIGLCVLSLAAVPLSFLFKDTKQRTDDPSWSSRQGEHLIVSGPIKKDMDVHSRSQTHIDDIPSLPARREFVASELPSTVSNTINQVANRQITVQRLDTRHRPPPPTKEPASLHTPTNEVSGAASEPTRKSGESTEKPRQEVAIEGASTAPDATVRTETHIASSAIASQKEMPAPNEETNPPTGLSRDSGMPVASSSLFESIANANVASSVTSSPAAPKTREEVEQELIRARKNGSLPRFGNPDPYGPGGSPNQEAE